ncbi:hypothetical protein [Galbibacter mesophilus]|uniref:hypothetical protein n=1 Tax=Galbibacter mesophilus TaxID=379069 RepID=UPI00191D9F98|nr:hypothetical protein [Galbibacter mesophilus]MCM5662849.1 hypothetical protein [Galbibacter mesophilus]
MKTFSTYLMLLISALCLSQASDSTQLKEIEFVEMITYGSTVEIFKGIDADIKIDETYVLPWQKELSYKESIGAALDTLIKNSTIKIEKNSFSDYVLRMESYFPEFINEGLMDAFELSVVSSDIKNNGQQLNIQDGGMVNFGFHSYSGYKNGSSYSHSWRTIDASYPIKSEVVSEDFQGTAQFQGGFVEGYQYAPIKKSDIGKKVQLGNTAVTVVDILKNVVILDLGANEDLEVKLVNLNKEGNKMYYSDGFVSQTVYEDTYFLFKEKPNLTLEEYQKIVRPKFLKLKESKNRNGVFGKEFTALTYGGELQEAYVYMPIYSSKTFTVTYDDNKYKNIPQAPPIPESEVKLDLHFETENEQGILLGEDLNLLDEKLTGVKKVSSGSFVNILGKTVSFFNGKEKDYSCNGYKYVKIEYQGIEYVIPGLHVFKLEKVDDNRFSGTERINFYKAESRDYLKPIKPVDEMEFCEHNTYSPVIMNMPDSNSYYVVQIEDSDSPSKIIKSEFYDIIKVDQTENGYNLKAKYDGVIYEGTIKKEDDKYIMKDLKK